MGSLTNEEFDKYFKILQVVDHEYFYWQDTIAIKEHLDYLGIKIDKGEVYYSKKLRQGGFASVLRLSKDSMEKILELTVRNNELIQKIGQKLLDEKEIERRKAVKNL